MSDLRVIPRQNVSDEDYADYGKRNVPSIDKKLNKVHFAGNIGKKVSAADNEKTGKKQKRWNESEICGH
uniref:Uncharacterized protein n=1 Tax=Panagrolaimus davidi TaxID=227884 RepID=A0A914P932_9BILA